MARDASAALAGGADDGRWEMADGSRAGGAAAGRAAAGAAAGGPGRHAWVQLHQPLHDLAAPPRQRAAATVAFSGGRRALAMVGALRARASGCRPGPSAPLPVSASTRLSAPGNQLGHTGQLGRLLAAYFRLGAAALHRLQGEPAQLPGSGLGLRARPVWAIAWFGGGPPRGCGHRSPGENQYPPAGGDRDNGGSQPSVCAPLPVEWHLGVLRGRLYDGTHLVGGGGALGFAQG